MVLFLSVPYWTREPKTLVDGLRDGRSDEKSGSDMWRAVITKVQAIDDLREPWSGPADKLWNRTWLNPRSLFRVKGER